MLLYYILTILLCYYTIYYYTTIYYILCYYTIICYTIHTNTIILPPLTHTITSPILLYYHTTIQPRETQRSLPAHRGQHSEKPGPQGMCICIICIGVVSVYMQYMVYMVYNCVYYCDTRAAFRRIETAILTNLGRKVGVMS
jgi:hypothetical protein